MPTEIGKEEVRRLLEQGAQLVDVLPAKEYGASHLAGAVNVPLSKLDRQTAAQLRPDRPIIVYCYDYQ
ncbi:MAG: rhodanese-like domain-containing protein [Anaerolineae bacterium]|nr:rhodanese-like domain-containing protein [Anaerolineae bacterium]